jgi:hypothetical protein
MNVSEVTFTGQSGTKWKYDTTQVLGKGGFGHVYGAEGPDGTLMAVKVVDKKRSAGILDDRLLRREIEIGRRVLDSGGDMLLPVIDAAEADAAVFLVMPRAGDPLSAVLPLTEADAITALTDIATGLQQLHQAAILHRDLKPPNVLSHEGHWKLADFGIARDEEIGTQDPTFKGAGSLAYMAPELWELKSPTVKTDLYAVGCLAYELLAGVPPYTGDLQKLRAAHLTQSPPEAPYANPAVRNLITRLLSKDPAGRPQDARAVLDRLNRAALPRTAVQDALARGLGAHQTELSRAAADAAATAAAVAARRQIVTQGHTDLTEIFGDALEDLQAIEPDAAWAEHGPPRRTRYPSPKFFLGLSAAGVGLKVYLWEKEIRHEEIPDDTMLIAGHVDIANPRHPNSFKCANVVYEQVEDRYAWRVYKFHGSGLIRPDSYRFGPYGRTHGFDEGTFANERSYMLRPGTHVWSKTVELLTAETALKLFQEAVDLAQPDYRTGLF